MIYLTGPQSPPPPRVDRNDLVTATNDGIEVDYLCRVRVGDVCVGTRGRVVVCDITERANSIGAFRLLSKRTLMAFV